MELELLAMGSIAGIGALATPCRPLAGSRDPTSDQRSPFDECAGGVDSRPVFRIPDEAFFDPLCQVVTQSGDLARFVVVDLRVAIGRRPEGTQPFVQATDFLGSVALEEPHGFGRAYSRR